MTTLSLLDPNLIAKLSPSLPDDEIFMVMAIQLAKQGELTTRPNPCVGCVLVKDAKVIGKGFHPKAGLPQREIAEQLGMGIATVSKKRGQKPTKLMMWRCFCLIWIDLMSKG